MEEEKPKKKRKQKAAAEGDGEKAHKKNWREYLATVEDIQTFLANTVLLRQNAITGRPEFRVPMKDEFEALGMIYPTGGKPLDEWRSAVVWQPVCDRLGRRGGGEQLHPCACRSPGHLQDHLVQLAVAARPAVLFPLEYEFRQHDQGRGAEAVAIWPDLL